MNSFDFTVNPRVNQWLCANSQHTHTHTHFRAQTRPQLVCLGSNVKADGVILAEGCDGSEGSQGGHNLPPLVLLHLGFRLFHMSFLVWRTNAHCA